MNDNLQTNPDRGARIGSILGDLQRVAVMGADSGDEESMGAVLEACRSMALEAMLISEQIEMSERTQGAEQ